MPGRRGVRLIAVIQCGLSQLQRGMQIGCRLFQVGARLSSDFELRSQRRHLGVLLQDDEHSDPDEHENRCQHCQGGKLMVVGVLAASR